MTMEKKNEEAPVMPIIAYKGFDKDWRCRDFQYKVGESFTHDGNVKACESGFHACEYPLDVFAYYPPAGNRYAVVEQSGELDRHGSDTKISSKSISIVAEISIAGLVKAAIEYTSKRCTPINPLSPASATGDRGAASATGYRGAASATGDQGAASATGYQGAASATGYRGAASATGTASVAIATGRNGRAKAASGCAIVLAHRDDDGNIVHIKASKVGENGIQDGVWYTLDSLGNFVEEKVE